MSDGHLCKRCGRDLSERGNTTSWFDAAAICIDCSRDEAHCPNYERARLAEANAVRGGDFNYAGIGLKPEDEAVLAQRRAARGRQ